MTFADAILKLRSERRLSQTQLAEELGVSYTSVNRWENGKTHPTKMTLPKAVNDVPCVTRNGIWIRIIFTKIFNNKVLVVRMTAAVNR